MLNNVNAFRAYVVLYLFSVPKCYTEYQIVKYYTYLKGFI